MLKNLHIEWLKIRRYRTFWIFSILFFVTILGINYFSYEVKESTSASSIFGSPFSFPNVWQTVTYLSSYSLFIPGILMITLFTNEYTYRTHRQNIIDGWSRSQFIHVKLTMILIIAIITTLIAFLNVLLFGLSKGSPFSADKIEYIFYFFIQAISYTSIAFIIALLIKRSGLAVVLYLSYAFIIDNVFKLLLNKYFWQTGNYLPLETTDVLIPIPFFGNVLPYQPNHTTALIMALVYLILYYAFANWKFKTADL